VAEDSEHLVISGNSIDHNPEYRGKSTDQLVLRRCRNLNLTGTLIQHTREAEADVEASVVLEGCQNVNVSGCQVLGARTRGIDVRQGSAVRISDSIIRPRQGDASYRAAVRVDDKAQAVMVTGCLVGKGGDGDVLLPKGVGVASGNLTV
jgi:polygalacturonase